MSFIIVCKIRINLSKFKYITTIQNINYYMVINAYLEFQFKSWKNCRHTQVYQLRINVYILLYKNTNIVTGI